MTNTRYDRYSHAYDLHAAKEEQITHQFRLEDLTFDSYHDPCIVCDWLVGWSVMK